MKTRISSLLALLLVLLIIYWLYATKRQVIPAPFTTFDSSYFPKGFMWGTATSAYQVEGATDKFGRGPSIWDYFTHEFPDRIDDHSNGDVADESYTYYAQDGKRMNKELNMNAYRFSISWSRVIPTGRKRDGVNEEGIKYYNKVITDTINNGMEPFVTLFHWDVPLVLENQYKGFLSPNIVDDFKDYVTLCFERFGNRVKYWITLNEPFIFTTHGYDSGDLAPGRCSSWVNKACVEGDSATEPYIVAHHLLLAHANAVQQYKQMGLKGKIGITLDITWPLSYSDHSNDLAAVYRNLDFAFGWFMDPLTYGRYPKIMRKLVPDRLPTITRKDSKLLKGSYDFIGLNYYTSNYVAANTTYDPDPTHIRFATDSQINLTKFNAEGKYIGLQASPSWLYVVPEGIRYALNYTKDAYKNPSIYITENGVGDALNLSEKDAHKDIWRIEYHKSHLWDVLRSICDYKVKVKGYFAWSFIDNFEWSNGYSVRMGIYAVADRNTGDMARRAKLSAAWFKEFLKNKKGGPKCGLYETKIEGSSLENMNEL